MREKLKGEQAVACQALAAMIGKLLGVHTAEAGPRWSHDFDGEYIAVRVCLDGTDPHAAMHALRLIAGAAQLERAGEGEARRLLCKTLTFADGDSIDCLLYCSAAMDSQRIANITKSIAEALFGAGSTSAKPAA